MRSTVILDDEPIQVGPLLQQLRTNVHLMYVDLPAGASPFDDPGGANAIETSVNELLGVVEDSRERENEFRRSLAWLLNQSDEALADLLERGSMAFPSRDIADRRRFLEMVWERIFASWRFEPDESGDDREVLGLPG